MNITVGQLIVKYMERLGIEYVFGIPGAHILPVYDGLYDSPINCILTKHEQGAAFMAGGYTRVSRKIAACVTTAGPGSTNLVTGVADCYVDKLPLLVITGEAPTYVFGKGGLQESSGEGGSIDQFTLFKGITKYNRIVERTDYLPQVLARATKVLLSDNTGPVLLSFPYNIQLEFIDDSILEGLKTEKHKIYRQQDYIPVNEMIRLIRESKNPVIVAGYGCLSSKAEQVISNLCHTLNIPIVTSIKGRGIIPEKSKISLGNIGVTSNGIAYKYIIEKADLLIFLGASFNERTSYLWDRKLIEKKKLIQVDNNEEQIEKVFNADIAVKGDVKEVISRLLREISNKKTIKKELNAVLEYKKIKNEAQDKSSFSIFREKFFLVENFYQELERQFSQNIIIFDDNIIFAQNFYHVSSSNSYFSNAGISSLGHAVSAAIGAKLFELSEKKPIFAILGDGGFQMCCMEIMTAVNYNLPLTIVVYNNSTLGLIRKNQFQFYSGRLICNEFKNPDYFYLAKSFNIAYRRINKSSDIEQVFKELDFINSINLIEIMLDKDLFPDYPSKR